MSSRPQKIDLINLFIGVYIVFFVLFFAFDESLRSGLYSLKDYLSEVSAQWTDSTDEESPEIIPRAEIDRPDQPVESGTSTPDMSVNPDAK